MGSWDSLAFCPQRRKCVWRNSQQWLSVLWKNLYKIRNASIMGIQVEIVTFWGPPITLGEICNCWFNVTNLCSLGFSVTSFFFIPFLLILSKSSWFYCLPNKISLEPNYFLFASGSQRSHLLLASALVDLQLGSAHSGLSTIFRGVLTFFFVENSLSLSIVATRLPVITPFPEHTKNPRPSRAVSLCGAGASRVSIRNSRRS